MNTAMDRIKAREDIYRANRVGDYVKSGNTYGLVTLIDEKRMMGYVIWEDGSCGEFSLYTHLHAPGWTAYAKEKVREIFKHNGSYIGEPYQGEGQCLGEEHE